MKEVGFKFIRIMKSSYNKFFWRRKNKHNCTTNGTGFGVANVQVGRETYGTLNVHVYNKGSKLCIGNYCSIADNVNFLLGGAHDYSRISTYPFQSRVYKQVTLCPKNNNITIEDDVWIGFGTLILAGVTIGKGSVIGAMSVVAKDIPPYSVYIGNKVSKKRFNDEIIDILSSIDYETVNHCKGDVYEKFAQTSVNDDNIDYIFKAFSS